MSCFCYCRFRTEAKLLKSLQLIVTRQDRTALAIVDQMSSASNSLKFNDNYDEEYEEISANELQEDWDSSIGDEQTKLSKDFLLKMIDIACSGKSAQNGNIFTYGCEPQQFYDSFFRNIVPSHDVVRQHDQVQSPTKLFNYDGKGGDDYSFRVLDRRTNQIILEQMPSYHKFGMRLLFSGPMQRELLNKSAIKHFFARQTRRLGKAFDDPKSCENIPEFVETYNINMHELLLPKVTDYESFNEFFYRKLKRGARPIADADDPNILVSAADCRLMVFDNVQDATRIWIKGEQFTLENLFHEKQMAEKFRGGSIAVFRLAPADYHRFHSPVDGQIGSRMKTISGTYYTVNPVAIRENIDVLTKNKRIVMTIKSPSFGRVAFVAIGALLVGSINFTISVGQNVMKGDELGYFAYGGSTIVGVFEPGIVKWDEDLMHNAKNAMETLVRVGERIGQRRTDAERDEYLSFVGNTGVKDATLNQLLNKLPMFQNSQKD